MVMPNPAAIMIRSPPKIKKLAITRHFLSGANRDRTGDLLLAKKPV